MNKKQKDRSGNKEISEKKEVNVGRLQRVLKFTVHSIADTSNQNGTGEMDYKGRRCPSESIFASYW